MRIETGEQLSRGLRKLGDGIKKRLWIAVPFIGSLELVKQVLGERWLRCDDVRLITDLSNLNNINYETVKCFDSAGKIKTLAGLHAKIYILDNEALVTSANLTCAAFSKLFEIGVFLSEKETKSVIHYYNELWTKEAEDIRRLEKPPKSSAQGVEEASSRKLATRWSLPEAPLNRLKQAGVSEARQRKKRPSWYLFNTNINNCDDNECEKDMIKHQKVAAYYEGHKELIDDLEKDDVVFLYRSGKGIVAMGKVSPDKRKTKLPPHEPNETKKEEYFKTLDNFKILKGQLCAAKIKKICNKYIIFRKMMVPIDEKSGERLKKEIMKLQAMEAVQS